MDTHTRIHIYICAYICEYLHGHECGYIHFLNVSKTYICYLISCQWQVMLLRAKENGFDQILYAKSFSLLYGSHIVWNDKVLYINDFFLQGHAIQNSLPKNPLQFLCVCVCACIYIYIYKKGMFKKY